MDNNKNIVVGFSVGDLNGVGLEIILSIFEDKRMLEFCTPVIFGSQKSLNYVKKNFNFSMQFFYAKENNQISENKINVITSYKDDFEINFGEENSRIGEVAIESFTAATKALKDGDIDVLVTAPINKYNIQSDAFKFPGHTNYLNEELEGQALMFMVNDGLRVGLLTDHVPVKDVSSHITSELIQSKIKTVYNSLFKFLNLK
jgi:4-hydroxy-L-threonine phosphate dehydrogenase PdxA